MNQMSLIGAAELAEKRWPKAANSDQKGDCEIEMRLEQEARLGGDSHS
jgi:hypothetical protein